jgi:sterol 3beta-glucosyltransferase
MNITVNTFGTRGDIQPYIALSLGLQQSGHSVRIFTHKIFETFVSKYDLDFYPLDLDPREVLLNQALAELGNNTIRITRWMKNNFRPVLREIFEATLVANQDTKLMLNSGLSLAGWHVAEKRHIPSLAAFLWPMTPSRHLMGAIGKMPPGWLPFKGLVNYYTTKLFNQLFYNLMLPSVNECRKEILGLAPIKARDYWELDSPQSATSIIYGYSPSVVPKPPDWSDRQQISGYWFLDSAEGYQPEKSLLDFLSDGPPPVYIGFGSMVDHERDELTQIVLDALSASNHRGVLLGGWGALGSGTLPDSVLHVDAVPHDWLFPRMAAVVHHGGAGTIAAGLRAGVPSVIVPSFGDQFFWGWQVHKLGVGSEPIPRKRLTVDKLVRAIRQVVTDDNIKTKASQVGQKIRSEKGVDVAVGMIERFARDGQRPGWPGPSDPD